MITILSDVLLQDNSNVANPSWPSIPLPAGRVLLSIGTRAGNRRKVTGITHPAILSATELRYGPVGTAGANKLTPNAWEVQSSGGTGTLQVTFDGAAYNTMVCGLQLSDLGALLAYDEDVVAAAASFTLAATASGVGGGVALCCAEPGNGSGAMLSGSPWDDASSQLEGASGYARLRTIAENGNVSGQTVTFQVTSGTMGGAGLVLLFAAAGGGGGGGGGAGALIPGVAIAGM
jgi:hypothetical protein